MTIKTERILTRAKKLIKKGEIEDAKDLYSSIKILSRKSRGQKRIIKIR